jgi:hypothetical protein
LGAIDRTWFTLDKFSYSYYHEWKKNYTCQYKIWTEFISFDIKKKIIIILKFCGKKKLSLKILRVLPCVSNGILQSCFDHLDIFWNGNDTEWTYKGGSLN